MKIKINLLYSLILLGSSVVISMQLFAEEKAGIIQKSTPTGIWCLLPSYSYKHPDQMDRLNETPCWTNPNVDGIVLRADWDKIEPTESKIDFSYFDRGFELAKKYDKRIEILVPAGKHSPEWVYAAGAENAKRESTSVVKNVAAATFFLDIPFQSCKKGCALLRHFRSTK
jgi:hypothetical protein